MHPRMSLEVQQVLPQGQELTLQGEDKARSDGWCSQAQVGSARCWCPQDACWLFGTTASRPVCTHPLRQSQLTSNSSLDTDSSWMICSALQLGAVSL